MSKNYQREKEREREPKLFDQTPMLFDCRYVDLEINTYGYSI